jgi:hypothetical protein
LRALFLKIRLVANQAGFFLACGIQTNIGLKK